MKPDIDPVKTTFILPDLRGGGAQSVMLSLAGAIDQARFEPTLAVLGETTTFRDRVPDGIPLVSCGHERLRQINPLAGPALCAALNLTLLSQLWGI